ncbi:Valyl-tRNA synthetase, partial [Pseudoloma neurophilia]
GSSGENHNPTGSSGERKRLGWVVARNKDEALEKATKQYNTLSKATLCVEQDEDVLDTWFSSAFWPFSIMGWPTETDDFKKYFPASILETGSDILFFWVARMVMASFAIFDKPPFEKILLHGIVRDANGRKMSKSLGNVVDPIHVIEGVSLNTLKETVTQTNLKKEEIDTALDSQEKDFPNGIPRCGTDALRFALCSYTSGLKDINLNILRVEGYRKFANKIWNAYKFINMQFENKLTKKTHDYMKDSARSFYTKYFTNAGSHPDYLKDNILEKLDQLSIKEKKKSTKSENTYSSSDSIVISDSGVIEWLMLHRNALIQEYTIEMESFNFMVVTQKVHQFIISIFCDIFIEITKKTECVEHLMACLFIFKDILLLLHPFMPFLTEELFQRMRNLNLFDNLKHSIVIEEFPTSSERIFVENDFSQAIQVVKAIRSLIDAQNTGKQSDSKKTYKVIMNKPEIVFFSKQIKTLCKKVETVEYSKIIECDITEKIDDMIFGIVEK